MKIRLALPQDDHSIEQLTLNAFKDHPYHAPGAEPTEHKIIQQLRAIGCLTLSLVAEDTSGVIGHISFSPVTINREKSSWFGLAPLSVDPRRQKEGIGSKLVNAGLEHMQQLDAEGIVLLGEPAFYGRFGFQQNPHLTLPNTPPEYFLVLPLKPDGTIPNGIVEFNSAFFEH